MPVCEKAAKSISRKLEKLSIQLSVQASEPIAYALEHKTLTPATLTEIKACIDDVSGTLHWFGRDIIEGRY